MNSTRCIINPRVHDQTVSVIVDTCDYADDNVIHVILKPDIPFYTRDYLFVSFPYVHCMKKCFCKIENHLIDVVDIKNHFL